MPLWILETTVSGQTEYAALDFMTDQDANKKANELERKGLLIRMHRYSFEGDYQDGCLQFNITDSLIHQRKEDDPTPEEIRKLCEEIRKEWPNEDLERRKIIREEEYRIPTASYVGNTPLPEPGNSNKEYVK